MPRVLAALSLTAVASLSLAGCTLETQSCKNGTCTIKLHGANASTKLGGDGGSTITLISTTDKTAKVKIASSTGVLTVGQPIQLSNASLELTEVKGNDNVVIKLVGSESK